MLNPTVEGGAERPLPVAKHYGRFGFRGVRARFRSWRLARPFWGGLLSILGGAIIGFGPATAFKIILVAGQMVWIGILVGVLITVFGLFLWFAPNLRHLISVLIVIGAVLSFITSDLGGFVIGMLLAMIGGSLGFAWIPVDPETIKPRIWHRRARREWKERRRLAKAGGDEAIKAAAG